MFALFIQTIIALEDQEEKIHIFGVRIDSRVELNLRHFMLFWFSFDFEDDDIWTFCFSLLLVYVTISGLWMEM